jgi:YD repeat-containing protein
MQVHSENARTLALGLVLSVVSLVWWPVSAYPDYPALEGRGLVGFSGTIEVVGDDDVTACAARGSGYSWGHEGPQECGPVTRFVNDFPISRGWCANFPLDPDCRTTRPVLYCPFGGTLSDTTCINTPPCQDGEQRDPVTGACGAPPKNRGSCGGGFGGRPDCPECCAGNPVNAGTGSKVQVESVYSSPAGTLLEKLTYNSQTINDQFPMATGAYGKGWKGNYQRNLNGIGAVRAERPSGQVLTFQAPPSGNAYVADADVADRLERLTDASGALTGWKYVAAADDSAELYGPTGQLLSITSRAGLTTTFTYSTGTTPLQIAPTTGLLIAVTDALGRSLNYAYDSQQRVVAMTDPAGGNYGFAYDASGNLVSITFPDTMVRAFTYNEGAFTQGTALLNALTGITDENATRFATFAYDTQGRAVSSEHAGGADRVTVDYPSSSARTLTDTLGVPRSYGIANVLGVFKNTGITGAPCPSCGPAARTFDANGNVASKTDWNGNVTSYSYDLTRNLPTSRAEAAGTPQARTISTQWHPSFRLPAKVAEPLRITTYVYNGDGGVQCGFEADGVALVPGVLCSKTIQPTSDATGAAGFGATPMGTARTWTYSYNANGSVLTMDGPRTDASDVTTTTYYSNTDADTGKRGNVATISNALGHTTSITAYNTHGQPLTIVDPNGMITTLAYDARQRLTSRNVGGEATTYAYDGVGQLTRVTLPDGSFLSYSYDAAHRLTGIADNLGNRIAYALDAMGNRTQEQVLDPANVLAQTRSRVFSNLNRLAQELGAQSQTTQYAYDNQGNVTSVTDPLNHATSNQYDALNRLIRITDPNLGQTQYAYNGIDQLVSVTDPRNLPTTYSYDGLSNLNSQLSPDTGTTTNTYDAAGNLLTQTDAKGQVTTYTYDALNRVASVIFFDGSKQNYAYDLNANGVGRLTSITELDPAQQVTSVIAYAYDLHGRPVSDTRTLNGVQYTLGYTYDSFGRLSGMTYPTGRTVSYLFDGLGRISQIDTTPLGGSARVVANSIAYQPFGGVSGYVLGNGQTYTRGFDLDGRIAAYNLGSQAFAIGYDSASRISFITESANPSNTNTYSYDSLDRLIGAALPNLPFAYGYDAVGNRTSRTVGSSTDSYVYSATSNQVSSITPQGGAARNFGFDANGSTTNDGINQYAYDARGRMVQSTGALGVTSYQVNALGQRVRKTNATEDRVYVYDIRGHLIAESDSAGVSKREYFYLGDIPVAVVVQ